MTQKDKLEAIHDSLKDAIRGFESIEAQVKQKAFWTNFLMLGSLIVSVPVVFFFVVYINHL
jgi:hypothetical protein